MASEICSLWKFTSAYLNQIPREIIFLLTKNLHEKSITESQDRRNFDSACALFVICIRVTLSYSTSMKNAPVLSQSDANNFFIFIIILITQGRREVTMCMVRFWTILQLKTSKKKTFRKLLVWFNRTRDGIFRLGHIILHTINALLPLHNYLRLSQILYLDIISIGNHYFSRANWNDQAIINFSLDNKFHPPHKLVYFSTS